MTLRNKVKAQNGSFDLYDPPDDFSRHFDQFWKLTLNLTFLTLTMTFQGHKVIYQRSSPNNTLDPLPMHTEVVQAQLESIAFSNMSALWVKMIIQIIAK